MSIVPKSSAEVLARDKRTALTRDGIWGNVLFGLGTTCLLVFGLGVWGSVTKLAGAVIASGTVVVESSVKKVQHETGGTVGAINVHEGDRVSAGQVLIRLDDTMTRASLQILSQQYDRILARQGRLEAERIGQRTMRVPRALQDRANDSEIRDLIAGEQALFESRTNALSGQEAQLQARVGQFEQQIEGLKAQRQATDDSLALLTKDLGGLEDLYAKKLVGMERMSDQQLDVSRFKGESGRLTAAIAEIQGRISEAKLQMFQLDEQMRSSVNTDLRDDEGKAVELVERKLVAQNQLARVDIRSPQDGYVQELSVHAVGSVIGPGETVMLIVPTADGLVIDALVSPASIDDVRSGQAVEIRFPAFDTTTTPQCAGTVQRISADLIRDPNNKVSYYSARIGLKDEQSCLGGTRKLLPGMPAEVHIQTGERGVWSYIFKPLSDQVARAFRQ